MALCSNLALVTVTLEAVTVIGTLEVVGPAVPGHSTAAVKVVEAAGTVVVVGTVAVEAAGTVAVEVGTAGRPQVPG